MARTLFFHNVPRKLMENIHNKHFHKDKYFFFSVCFLNAFQSTAKKLINQEQYGLRSYSPCYCSISL